MMWEFFQVSIEALALNAMLILSLGVNGAR